MEAQNYFREILRTELKLRQQSNPRYSLRGFARQLGLSPSYLCELMNPNLNKRASKSKIAQILARLAQSTRNTGMIDRTQEIKADLFRILENLPGYEGSMMAPEKIEQLNQVCTKFVGDMNLILKEESERTDVLSA